MKVCKCKLGPVYTFQFPFTFSEDMMILGRPLIMQLLESDSVKGLRIFIPFNTMSGNMQSSMEWRISLNLLM